MEEDDLQAEDQDKLQATSAEPQSNDVKSDSVASEDGVVRKSPEQKNYTQIEVVGEEDGVDCRKCKQEGNQSLPEEPGSETSDDDVDGDGDDVETDDDEVDLSHWCCDPEVWIALFGFICFTWSLLQAFFFVFVMKNAWQFDEDKVVAASSGGCMAVALLYSLSTFAITLHTFQNLDLCLCCCPSLFLTASLWEGRRWRSFWWSYSILSLLVALINVGLCVWWGAVSRDDIPMIVSAISTGFYVIFWVVLLRTLRVEKNHRKTLADIEMTPQKLHRLDRLPSTSILRPAGTPIKVV